MTLNIRYGNGASVVVWWPWIDRDSRKFGNGKAVTQRDIQSRPGEGTQLVRAKVENW